MKKLDFKRIAGFLIIILLVISGNLYGQSSSFGNTYIFNNGEMGIVNIQHNFLNGGSGIQPGKVGTDRTAPQGFMSFVGNASWTGASDGAHVDGYVKTYMTTPFTFPIGDNGKYRPVAISKSTLANPTNAAYFGVSASSAITSSLKGGNEPVLPASGPFDTALKGTDVLNVDNVEYWDINGATPAKITLTWDATSSISSLTSLSILGWNGTQWVAISSTVDTTSLLGGSSSISSGSITTSATIIPDSYEVYTLGTVCGSSLAPVISSTALSNICPATVANLNSLVTSSTPLGYSLVWFTNSTHTGAAYATPTAAVAGTYYPFYYDSGNNCYSPSGFGATVTITTPPDLPTASSTIQPNCNVNTGTIVLTIQSGVEYSINNGSTYQSSPTFSGLTAGIYTLKVRNSIQNQCSAEAASTVTINAAPTTPTLSGTNLTNNCPLTTANLNALVTSNTPSGTALVWFTNNTHTGSAYATPSMAVAGTYYAFYFDSQNSCYTAASVAVTISLDSDCDTIPDSVDIDDDNDGILDTVEANCTPSNDKTGLTLSVTPGFEGPTSGMVTTGNGLIDGLVNQNTICWGSVPYVNRTILTFSFAKPTSLKGMELSVNPATSTILSQGNVLQLQAYDGSAWVTLATYTQSTIKPSVIINYPNVIGFYPSQVNPYTQYRVFGVNAILGPGGIFMSEAIFDIQPQCNGDVDADGIPNSLDLDSDGDGCPDAKEAGVPGNLLTGNIVNGVPNSTTNNVPNTIAQGSYGTNGLANSLENNDTLAATINFTSTYSSNAISKVINACADTDADGIFDIVDLDDDNDGVLDATEAPSCYYTQSEVSGISLVTSQLVAGSYPVQLNWYDNSAATLSDFTPAPVFNQEIYNITPIVSPLAVSAVSFDMTSSSILAGTATAKLQGFDGATWIDLSTAQTATVINGTQTFTNSLHPTIPYLKYRLYGVSGNSSNAYCSEIHLIPSAASYGSSSPKPSCFVDTDADGITNDKDLDSDGDLCPDAKEAGVPGTLLSGTIYNTSGTLTVNNALISGSVGLNGLANSLETNDTASGITSFITTYSPYAMSSLFNACTDTDGDGILDLADIDDDNDGTLDAVEAPSCYYSSSEIAIPSLVITELTIDTGSLSMIHDNDVATTQSFDAQTIASKSIYEVTPASPVAITSLNLNDATTIFVAANKVKLQGWTGASWIDLSVSATPPAVVSGVISFTNTISPTIAYPKYRLYGDPTSTGNINTNVISEITLTATAYQASKYPKGTCTVNTDGDSLTNDKDPDSDGDGCSDAKEASATTSTTANYVFTGNVGANGLDNSLETAIDSGIINYASTYQYAISNTLNGCTDTDGDTIGDLVDLDDDNDGILDVVEAPSCYYTQAEISAISSITTQLAPYSTNVVGNSYDNNAATYSAFAPSIDWAGQDLFNITPVNALPISGVELDLSTWALSNGATNTFKLQGYDGTSWIDLSLPVSSTGTTGTFTISNVLQPNVIYQKFKIVGVVGTTFYGGVIQIRLVPVMPYLASSNPKPTCLVDTDNDRITNDKDLDSDGDGCPDAKEAGVTGTLLPGSTVNSFPNVTTPNVPNAKAQGPYGINGLANSIETNDTSAGITTYASNYNPNATSIVLNGCKDTDGDGITDLIDIDDDNDGIVDAVEAPSCYYTADESKVISSITSQLAPYSTYVIGNSYDNNASTSSAFSPSIDWVGLELFNISPTNALPISGVELDLVNWALSNAATNTFKLRGYNGSIWVDLSAPVASTATTGTFTISNTLQPNVSYQKYDIVGVVGTTFYGGVTEARLVPSTTYQTSLFPKATCTVNTDGDSLTNDKDPDSDGDGCSDAKEASATTSTAANFAFTGNVGANGLDNSLETSIDSGIINYASTYQYAISNILNSCTDTDGDTIGDLVDLDDDNDGILDAVEAPSCYYTQAEISGISSVTSQLAASSYPTRTMWYDNNATTFSDFNPNISVFNQEIYSITPTTSPLAVSAVSFDMTTYAILTAGSTAKLQGYDGTTWIDLSTAQTATVTSGTQTFTNTLQPTTAYQKFRLYGVTGTCYLGYCTEIHLIPSGSSYGSAAPKATCSVDTDGDGKTNDKDLDSDGDLCPDAKEAGVTGTLTSGTIFNTSGSTTANNALITGSVGSNGLANSIETNDTSGATTSYASTYQYAISSILNACIDSDGDGVGDIVDIDDDNDGVLDFVEQTCTSPTVSKVGATASMTLAAATGTVSNLLNGTEVSDFYYSGGQNIATQTVAQFNFPSSRILNKLEITTSGSTFLNSGATVKVQGWNGSTWIDITGTLTPAAISASTFSTNSSVKFDISSNTNSYTQYRILGLSGTVSGGPWVYEAYFSELNCVDIDTDGDTIPNRLDLDSDRDGCSDAKEAGATSSNTTNYAFMGAVGANGLVDILETSTESGIVNYTLTYANAINSAIKSCIITCPTVTNSAANNVNPTTCTGTNGSIKLCGLAAGESGYVINYAKNGTAATPLTNQTSDASGCVLISNLGAGVYSNIIITHPIYCATGTTAVGPITITAPTGPSVPTVNTTQPTCAVPTGTIVFTVQSGVEYSINNGFSYQPSTTFSGLQAGNYTLKVRSTIDPTCSTVGASPVTINATLSPPTLSSQSISTVCPSSTVNLNTLATSTTPANSSLVWFTNSAHTGVAYATPTMATEGTYYAFYFDTTLNCYTSATAAVTVVKICCAGELPPTVGAVLELNCAGATNYGTLFNTIAAPSGVTSLIPYTGGNGGNHNGQVVASTGVTGLTATLLPGDFATGSGMLTYTISGTPASVGTASFAINIGGKTCTLDRTVALLNSISSLNCSGTTNSGTLTNGIIASSVSSSVPYTGGDGSTHNGQIVTSTGVTGLTATLAPGTFAIGAGALDYAITGTPTSVGTASFALNIGGKTCTLTRTVILLGTISSLDCAGASNSGTLTNTVAASGVSSSVSYTGGNGATHNGQIVTSTGVTGLTATLVSGTFATGSGSLTYTITGTPTSVGTASFALNIGGQSCTLTRTVNPSGSITALNCSGATATGTLTNTIAASGVSSSVPYSGGNGATHNGQIVTSTGVTGLTATLSPGTFASGAGFLNYAITGTPTSVGTASFALNIGGQSCTLSIAVAVFCVNPNPVPAGYTDKFAILYNTNQVSWNQLRTGNGGFTNILPSNFATATPYDIAVRDDDSFFGANGPQAVDSTPHKVISISSGLTIPDNSRMSFYCNRSGNVTVGGQPVWSEGPIDIDNPSTVNYSIQGQYAPNPERTDLGTYVSVKATNATGSTDYIIYRVTIAGVSGTYFYVVAQSSTVSPKVLLNNATSITNNGISNWGPADLSYPNFPNTAAPWRIGMGGSATPASCN